jgi:hypothetical protein
VAVLAFQKQFAAAAEACKLVDLIGLHAQDQEDAQMFVDLFRAKLLYQGQKLGDCIAVIQKVQSTSPEVSRCLRPEVGFLQWKNGDLEQASRTFKEYFDAFDPAQDAVTRTLVCEFSCPIPHQAGSLVARLEIDTRVHQSLLSPGIGCKEPSYRGALPSAVLGKNDSHYYTEPLYSMKRGAYSPRFEWPWRYALLWARLEFERGDLPKVRWAIDNIYTMWSNYGAYIPNLNERAVPSTVGLYSDSVGFGRGKNWLKSESVQEAAVEFVTIATLADYWGLSDDARRLFGIVKKAFVDSGHVDSICGTVLEVNLVRDVKWKSTPPHVSIAQDEELAWMVMLSSGDQEVDLSEERVLGFVHHSEGTHVEEGSQDLRAMYVATNLIARCTAFGYAPAERQAMIGLASRLLDTVGTRDRRYATLLTKLSKAKRSLASGALHGASPQIDN